MFMYWVVYGLATWGLATVLNRLVFNKNPASTVFAWSSAVIFFICSIVILSAIKFFEYKALSSELGINMAPNYGIELGGAVFFAYIFFSLIDKKGKPNAE